MKLSDIEVGKVYAYSRWESSTIAGLEPVTVLAIEKSPPVTNRFGTTVTRSRTEIRVRFDKLGTEKVIPPLQLRWTWEEYSENRRKRLESEQENRQRQTARDEAFPVLVAALDALGIRYRLTKNFVDQVTISVDGADAIRVLTAALTPSEQVAP